MVGVQRVMGSRGWWVGGLGSGMKGPTGSRGSG